MGYAAQCICIGLASLWSCACMAGACCHHPVEAEGWQLPGMRLEGMRLEGAGLRGRSRSLGWAWGWVAWGSPLNREHHPACALTCLVSRSTAKNLKNFKTKNFAFRG